MHAHRLRFFTNRGLPEVLGDLGKCFGLHGALSSLPWYVNRSASDERMGRMVFLAKRFEETERVGLWLHPSSAVERASLSRGVAQGALVVPVRGLYARRSYYEAQSKRERALCSIRSLASIHPAWLFCAFSAAVLHGLQVSYHLLGKPHIVQDFSSSHGNSSVYRHAYTIDRDDCVVQLGVQATSIERTLLDCLCLASFEDGLAIVDSAFRWGKIDRAALEHYVAENGFHRKGVCTARRVLRYADGRSENGGESVARAAMIELGFVVPDLQVEVVDPMEPANLKRCDFSWKLPDGRWIIGELDGVDKYVRNPDGNIGDARRVAREMSRERTREAHINLTDAKVVRFTFQQVMDRDYFERLLLAAGVPKC